VETVERVTEISGVQKRVAETSGVQKGLRKYRVFKKESTSLFITCLFYFLYLLFSYWDMFRASCWRKLVKIERNSFMFRYLRNFTLSNASQMWLHNFKDKMQNTAWDTEKHSENHCSDKKMQYSKLRIITARWNKLLRILTTIKFSMAQH
jgi:hypothetical protein